MNLLFWKKKPKTIGLTLSGGGMRGVAHIGIIKALEEFNLRPSVISGTSAGAIVGAFYAAGYSPAEMLDIVLKSSFFNRSSFRLRTTGIFNPRFVLDLFKNNSLPPDFKDLKYPLYIAATELSHGRVEYFSNGNLYDALLASASVPYIFPPVKIEDKIYLDGGIMNNLPIEPIRDKCNYLIGSHVNSIIYKNMDKSGAGAIFYRVIHLILGNPVYGKSQFCDLFIDPPNMTQYSFMNNKEYLKMHDAAYEYACRYLEERELKRPGINT